MYSRADLAKLQCDWSDQSVVSYRRETLARTFRHPAIPELKSHLAAIASGSGPLIWPGRKRSRCRRSKSPRRFVFVIATSPPFATRNRSRWRCRGRKQLGFDQSIQRRTRHPPGVPRPVPCKSSGRYQRAGCSCRVRY